MIDIIKDFSDATSVSRFSNNPKLSPLPIRDIHDCIVGYVFRDFNGREKAVLQLQPQKAFSYYDNNHKPLQRITNTGEVLSLKDGKKLFISHDCFGRNGKEIVIFTPDEHVTIKGYKTNFKDPNGFNINLFKVIYNRWYPKIEYYLCSLEKTKQITVNAAEKLLERKLESAVFYPVILIRKLLREILSQRLIRL